MLDWSLTQRRQRGDDNVSASEVTALWTRRDVPRTMGKKALVPLLAEALESRPKDQPSQNFPQIFTLYPPRVLTVITFHSDKRCRRTGSGQGRRFELRHRDQSCGLRHSHSFTASTQTNGLVIRTVMTGVLNWHLLLHTMEKKFTVK
jgi:hypothetical protein